MPYDIGMGALMEKYEINIFLLIALMFDKRKTKRFHMTHSLTNALFFILFLHRWSRELSEMYEDKKKLKIIHLEI